MLPLIGSAAIVALGGARADAGALADALKAHGPRDVAALRAMRTDVAARCTLGAVYARRDDLSRAALYLAGCEDAALPAEVSADVARIVRDVRKRLRDSDLAVVEIISHPGGMLGDIDALPGDTFTTPTTLYLKPGSYTVHVARPGGAATQPVTAIERRRGLVILDADAKIVAPHPSHAKVDFTKDLASETQQSGPPPDVKHGNLIRDKYLKGLTATSVSAADNPNAIDDPLAATETVRPARRYQIGIRIGGGMFDDGAAAARAGMSVAASGRTMLGDRNFLIGRLDWSRRGGEAAGSVDVIGASAGFGRSVVETRTLGIAVLAQLRGDLRLAGSRSLGTGMMTTPIDRFGVGVALGVELAIPRSPLTAGLRFEQGVTRFVPDARDRAVVFELGVDWR